MSRPSPDVAIANLIGLLDAKIAEADPRKRAELELTKEIMPAVIRFIDREHNAEADPVDTAIVISAVAVQIAIQGSARVKPSQKAEALDDIEAITTKLLREAVVITKKAAAGDEDARVLHVHARTN